jgi:hypothetical protein
MVFRADDRYRHELSDLEGLANTYALLRSHERMHALQLSADDSVIEGEIVGQRKSP